MMNVQKNMDSKNGKKKRLSVSIIILIALLPTFVIGFMIGKSYAANNTNNLQNEQEIVEPSINQGDEQIKEEPEDDKKESTDEADIDVSEEQEEIEEPEGKVVYLTFDDGPSQLTNDFLDVLQEHGVKATFFMQGNNLKKEDLQKSVKRATKEGHYIGAHSMTHEFNTLYRDLQFVPEMNETLALISDITGTNPKLVRPPYGSAPGLKSEEIRNQIVDANLKVWDWTIDSNDWKLKDHPNLIIENIKNGTNSDREVVLMHEKPQTLSALPGIIEFYKEQGYQFVVYDEANHFYLNFQNDIRM